MQKVVIISITGDEFEIDGPFSKVEYDHRVEMFIVTNNEGTQLFPRESTITFCVKDEPTEAKSIMTRI